MFYMSTNRRAAAREMMAFIVIYTNEHDVVKAPNPTENDQQLLFLPQNERSVYKTDLWPENRKFHQCICER